jgi:hypothetical protein
MVVYLHNVAPELLYRCALGSGQTKGLIVQRSYPKNSCFQGLYRLFQP